MEKRPWLTDALLIGIAFSSAVAGVSGLSCSHRRAGRPAVVASRTPPPDAGAAEAGAGGAAANAGAGGAAPAAGDPDEVLATALVQDFETALAFDKWPPKHPADPTLSPEWSSHGRQSLKLAPGLLATFGGLALADWKGYSLLRIHANNPTGRAVSLDVELQDGHSAVQERHLGRVGLAPGEGVVEVDIAGALWRGQEDFPYRGEIKTPLDTSHMTKIGLRSSGDAAVYVDQIEVVKVKSLETPGGFAFDFARSGTRVMGQMTGVFDTTAFTPERGYGMVGDKPASLVNAMSYPTVMLGGGLAWGGGGFRVDLPGGDYLGWIAFERGGFWSEEASGYARATLKANGQVVHEHAFSRSAQHFLFEDTELTDLAELEDKLVWPAHAISRFRFKASPGGETFTIELTDSTRAALRVAGLVLAPDTPAGRAFIDGHEARQRRAIRATYVAQDRSRRGDGREAPREPLVAEPLVPGAQMYPRDWPVHGDGVPLGEVTALTGRTATVNVGVYAQRPIQLTAIAGTLTGPSGATLAAPRTSHGLYLPMRPFGPSPVWLEINHYRPEASFTVGPDLGRSVLLEYDVPAGAKPGVYAGKLELAGGGERLELDVRVRVFDVALPPLPIPVGLLREALPFGPGPLGEDAWWRMQESLLAEQGRAGLTCATGGAGLNYRVQRLGVSAVLGGDAPLKYLGLAKKYGLDKAVVSYDSFLPNLGSMHGDAAAILQGLTTLEQANQLPPHFLYAYDEPDSSAEMEAATRAVKPFTAAGGRTLGYTSERKNDKRWDELVDATYAPCLNVHEADTLKGLEGRGKHPWVYSNGMTRYGLGLHLWRNIALGAEGRLEWIGIDTQGFAFDNLDGRSPSTAAWVVHDKFGPLPTPSWLSAREGLLDARVRLALEKAVPRGDPALALWTIEGYKQDRKRWTDEALEAARREMLERIEKAGGPSRPR